MPTSVAPPAWMTSAAAARLLDVDRRAVARFASRGMITVRDLPVRARFLRADVEAIAASQPTTAAAVGGSV